MDCFEIMRNGEGIFVKYDENFGTFDEEDKAEAIDNVRKIVKSDKFCKPGFRNDSVVDVMIHLHVLGVVLDDLLRQCLNAGWIDYADQEAAWEKEAIVEPYIPGWFGQFDSYQTAQQYLIGTVG